MKQSSLIAIAAAASLGAVLSGSPAKAVDWPWCADLAGKDGGGGTNCGFASWAQCQAAISGIGGWCYPNPYYRGAPVPRRRDRPRR
jgi:hypothetical protein